MVDRGILLRSRESRLSLAGHSMDTERDLIDAFGSVLHRVFANPLRDGCPGHDCLVKLVFEPGAPECAEILAHVRQCAPCFDELKQLREKRK